MKRTYKRKLETPVGTFYLLYNDSTDDIHCELLDSNSKWITNIYHRSTIRKLKNIQCISELVDLGIADNCTWGQSIEELANEINDVYFWEDECEEDRFTTEEMADYDFVNQVGTTYFIIDFE